MVRHRLIMSVVIALAIASFVAATRPAHRNDPAPVTAERLTSQVFGSQEQAECYLDEMKAAGIERGLLGALIDDYGDEGPLIDGPVMSDTHRAVLANIAVTCSPFVVEAIDGFDDALTGGAADAPEPRETATSAAGSGESAAGPRVARQPDVVVKIAADGSAAVIRTGSDVIANDPDLPLLASNR